MLIITKYSVVKIENFVVNHESRNHFVVKSNPEGLEVLFELL